MADSSDDNIPDDLESRLSNIEAAFNFEDRLKAIEAAVKHRSTTAVPWWKDKKTVTILGGILATTISVVTAIDGILKNNRDSQRLLMEQQDKIRQTYLDRVLKVGVAEWEQERVFSLLVKLKSDPELQEWAKEQYENISQRIENLRKEKQSLEERNQELQNLFDTERQKSSALTGQKTRQATIKVQQLEGELRKSERELNELRQRIGGTVNTSLPSPQITSKSNEGGWDVVEESFCVQRLKEAREACSSNGIASFQCDHVKQIFSYNCR
jgi:hypothetical protein